MVLFSSCSKTDEIGPTDNEEEEETIEPSFGDLGINGNAAEIIDIQAGTHVTYILLSDGSVWFAGNSYGLAEEEINVSFKKIFEGAKAIKVYSNKLAIIDKNNTLHKNYYVIQSKTGEIRQVANNVLSFVDGRWQASVDLPGYITVNNELFLKETYLPDSLWTGETADEFAFNKLADNVSKAVVSFSTSTGTSNGDDVEYHLLKEDGAYQFSSIRWLEAQEIYDNDVSHDFDDYYDYQQKDGNFYQLASNVQNITIGRGVNALMMEDGSLYILSTGSTREFRYWGDISINYDNLEIENLGKLHEYPTQEVITDVKYVETETWMLKGENGGVYATGVNSTGSHGDGTRHPNNIKFNLTKVYENVDKLTLGDTHSMLLLNNGDIKVSGSNGYGQYADGSTERKWDFDEVIGQGGGNEELFGTWTISNGTTVTFNSDGSTGNFVQVDETGQCSPTTIPFVWSTSGPSITITNGQYTICEGTAYSYTITSEDSSTVNYSISGNILTLNGQQWTKSS